MKLFATIQEELKESLNEQRFEHSLGVMYTAGCLAMAHGYEDISKAMLAGLLHDCAKCMSHEERTALCERHQVEIRASELENKSLLHAKAGAVLAKQKYQIEDREILHAIAVHTTGEPDMSILDKIVYIADYIEPLRTKSPNLKLVRALAYQDLNVCMAQILFDTLSYLKKRGGHIDITTEQTYEFYKAYRKEF